jgi:hypothetical protein
MKIKSSRYFILFIFLVSIVINSPFSTCFAQGALTPPGAPAPTMKSLDQVEPRTIVNAANTPGDAGDLFVITNSGSYYLTTNLVGVGAKNGVLISASHVTLDLNGFAIIGVSGSSDGISVNGNNVAIRNGTVCNWGSEGVYAENANNCQFKELCVSQNGSHGLHLGVFCRVSECMVQSNGNHGIFIATGGLVEACVSSYNADSGIVNYSFNSQIPNVLVTGCNVYGNQGSGIAGSEDIVDNICAGNAGGGIFFNSYGGRAERNHVLRNSNGGISLGLSSSTNIVIGNFLIGNTGGAISVNGTVISSARSSPPPGPSPIPIRGRTFRSDRQSSPS